MYKQNAANRKAYMGNGLIYPAANTLIESLQLLNLVEWLKRFGVFLAERLTGPLDIAGKIGVSNVCIDLFIIFKWALLAGLWFFHVSHPLVTSGLFYLIFFNVFTYFYHHVWKTSANQTPVNSRRRFVTAVAAVAFSIVCYAYLYDVVFSHEFGWPKNRTAIEPLYFSIASSLTVTFGDVSLLSPVARALCCSQLVNMFVFVATILSPGVPGQSAEPIPAQPLSQDMGQALVIPEGSDKGLEQKVG